MPAAAAAAAARRAPPCVPPQTASTAPPQQPRTVTAATRVIYSAGLSWHSLFFFLLHKGRIIRNTQRSGPETISRQMIDRQ